MSRRPALKKDLEAKSLSLKSPAKLNLYLKVLNKRKDGFHNIETVFEKIDLCDRLILKTNNAGRINIATSRPDCPVDRTNLCYKAAELLKQELRLPFGVDITIKKQIPVFSGLGGGSSNAATTLLGLNRLWGLSLSKSRLLSYARRLGSDVAFFIENASFAIGRGRGERIKPMKGIKPLWHILVVPDIKLSTAEAYKRIEMLRRRENLGRSSVSFPANTKMLTNPGYNVNILLRALHENKLPLLSKCLFNDFSESLFRTYPGLFKIKHRLKELGLRGVSLSGKGPSLFGLAKSRKEAREIKERLAKKRQRVFAVGTFKGTVFRTG